MEKRGDEYRALFKQVSPSVVIVEQVGRIDYFCVGSVIFSEGENTFILTQSKIAASSEKLSICFSNGFKQSAYFFLKLEEEEKLCILVTKFYSKCKAVEFSEDDIDHAFVGVLAPANRSSVYSLPGFIIQRPCEAGTHVDQSVIKGSEDCFNFTLQYGDRSANRVSRVLSGLVFNMKGQALGAVLDDMEYYTWPKKEDGTIFHKELYYQNGFFLKVGVTATRLKSLLKNMWGLAEWLRTSSSQAKKGRSPSLPPKKGSPSEKVRLPSPPPKKTSPPRKASHPAEYPAESAVLCIDHLSRNVSEAHLKEIFGNFGEIVNVELSMDPMVNLPRGYGYIEFKKRADAEKALHYMDGGQIDGNAVKLRFALQPCQRAASPMKAPSPPQRGAPQIKKVVSSAEKDARQLPRESSPQRKPASPPWKQSPNRRAESPRRPPDPSPRRRPDSPLIRRRPDPSPVRRGDTPPRRRPLSTVRRRSPSPPPRRHRSPMRPSPRRGRGSPSPRRRSPGPLRRRSPPPRRLRSPPRRPPPPRRYSRSPPRRPLRSCSRSISPRRGRGPLLRCGRSDSSYSRSPTPPPRKGPRRVSRSRSPRSSPPPRRLRSPPRRPPPPRRYSRSPPRRPLRSRSRSISPRRGRGPPLRHGRSHSSYSRSPTPPRRKGPRRVSRSRSPRRPPRGRSISSDRRSSSSPSPRHGR